MLVEYNNDDLLNAKKFKDHALILTNSYNTTVSGSYSMRYQSRMYNSSVLDIYLLNFKVNNNKPDFANSISNFSGEYAQSSLKASILEEKAMSDMELIKLPEAKKLKGSLVGALQGRKSSRNFSERCLKLQDLSNLLFHSLYASKDSEVSRLYPRKYASGGGLYPVSLYLFLKNVEGIESGFYKYQPFSNSLLKVKKSEVALSSMSNVSGIDVENTTMMGFWVFDKRISSLKYGDMSLTLALIELGEAMQTMNLVGYYYGLGFCELGGFHKIICEKELQLDGIDCHVVGCFVSGYSI